MAINFPNFLGQSDADYSGINNAWDKALKSYGEGVKQRNAPKLAEYDLEDKRLGNILKEAQAKYAEPLVQAQIEGLKAGAWSQMNPHLSQGPSSLGKLLAEQSQYGEGTPQYQQYADEIFHRTHFAPTDVTRINNEQQDIINGVYPGTKTPIESPEVQQQMLNDLELAKMKKNTDADIRRRNLYAQNIEKTLQSFDPKDLVQYSGVAGKIQEKLNAGLALTNSESENYQKYQKALQSVGLLRGQVRQFYGESVQNAATEHLESLINPSEWMSNPTIALQKFEQLRKILDTEMHTFQQAIKSPDIYGKNAPPIRNEVKPKLSIEEQKAKMFGDQLRIQNPNGGGMIEIEVDGEIYDVPADEVDAFKKAFGVK